MYSGAAIGSWDAVGVGFVMTVKASNSLIEPNRLITAKYATSPIALWVNTLLKQIEQTMLSALLS